MLLVKQLYENVGKDVGKDVAFLYEETPRDSTLRRNAILDLIKHHPEMTAAEIVLIQNVSARTIERDIDWLKSKGIIIREGSRSAGKWVIIGQ